MWSSRRRRNRSRPATRRRGRRPRRSALRQRRRWAPSAQLAPAAEPAQLHIAPRLGGGAGRFRSRSARREYATALLPALPCAVPTRLPRPARVRCPQTLVTLRGAAVTHETRPAPVDPGAAHLEWLATLGELAGPVVHEFNNFLNTVSLQLAILEREASPELLADLIEIRRQC